MTSTTTLGLPLVQPSQAQKHVTVNEALARLDVLAQLTLVSRSVSTPPAIPAEADAYAVPEGATDSWSGSEGMVAIFVNGGWSFVEPCPGWRAYITDEGTAAQFDGTGWAAGIGAVSANGAGTVLRIVEMDHVIAAGPSSETLPVIPAQSLVLGVTGRVLSDITGTATSWRLGIGTAADDRYGSGLGLAAGSWMRGLTAQPLAYYADTALTVTGEGGDLAGGIVRFAVHIAELGLPRA